MAAVNRHAYRMMRRQLLRPVRALQAGEPPVSAADGMAYAVRSATLVLGWGVPWTAGAHEATRSQVARLQAECAA